MVLLTWQLSTQVFEPIQAEPCPSSVRWHLGELALGTAIAGLPGRADRPPSRGIPGSGLFPASFRISTFVSPVCASICAICGAPCSWVSAASSRSAAYRRGSPAGGSVLSVSVVARSCLN